jgi:hypothetical protein
MHGTCLRTEPIIVHEDEEAFVFSFGSDISENQQITNLQNILTTQCNSAYNTTNEYLEGWRKYDKQHNLWDPKRKHQIEKLRPTCSNLDNSMGGYQIVIDGVEALQTIKDISFVHIEMSQVAIAVSRQAEVIDHFSPLYFSKVEYSFCLKSQKKGNE